MKTLRQIKARIEALGFAPVSVAVTVALTLLAAVTVLALALYLGSGSGDEFRDHLQEHEQVKRGGER